MIQAREGQMPKPTGDTKWAPWLEAATHRVMACNTLLTKERNRLRGAQIRVHSKKIQLAKVQLQLDPTNEHILNILSELQRMLAECFQILVERYNHHLATKWLRYRDTCFKTFFDFHQIDKKRTLLKELKVDEETISRHEDLSLHLQVLCQLIYIRIALTSHYKAPKEVLGECTFLSYGGYEMPQELSLEEVVEAITLLPKGKALGHDDPPTEFFHENVERGRDHPHAPPSIMGNALFRANLSFYQQRHDHLNPEF
jgi:hypothetical protein